MSEGAAPRVLDRRREIQHFPQLRFSELRARDHIRQSPAERYLGEIGFVEYRLAVQLLSQ
jgi:hypothetical protein